MKQLSILLFVFFIISCNNKKESEKVKTPEIKTDLTNSENQNQEAKSIFKKYSKDGILLTGRLPVFDEKFHKIKEIEIKEISKIKILEKSTSIYNIDNSNDYCLKSNFMKVEYKDKNYILFGRDVYEIDESEIFDFTNNDEKLSLFSVANFEMGAYGGEDGSTGCDDFSLLMILNKNNQKYFTLAIPENQEYKSNTKFANLIHDDGSMENVYHATVLNDSLIMGIKISYQEGYGSYFLRTSFKDNFSKSKITDQKRFEEESVYKQMK
jgi:hypothetical protein